MDECSKLLASRKIWEDGEPDFEAVVHSVRSLLYNQKLIDILKEKCAPQKEQYYPNLAGKLASKSPSQITEAISNFIKGKSDLQGFKIEQVATLSCIESLKSIIQEQSHVEGYSFHILTDENRNMMENMIPVMCKLYYFGNLDLKSFLKIYFTMENMPLEILYLFQESGLIESTSYIIRNVSRPQEISKLTTSLSEIICNRGDDEYCGKVAVGLISPLVTAFYGSAVGPVSSEMLNTHKPALKIVLSSLFKKINERLLSVSSKDKVMGSQSMEEMGKDTEINAVDIFTLLPSSPVLGGPKSQIIRTFFSNQLAEVLTFAPNVTLNQAFSRQSEWRYSKIPLHLRKLLSSLLAIYEAKEALDTIQKILNVGEVNWKFVLSCLSVYIVTKNAPATLLKDFVSSLVREAFLKSSREPLILALLTARQWSAEGHGFPPYGEWFGSMFGIRGTWGNSDSIDPSGIQMSSFQFLLTLITELVPMESIMGLRAHISYPPQAPPFAAARAILSDYLHLARTRLSDFGACLGDEGGLFRSNPLGNEEFSISGHNVVESEVEVVLSHFEKTGNILKTVLEASVFRKRYLEQTFLPELLKPRNLPSEPDTRMKVIERLNSKGLISAAVYSNYLKGCEEESKKMPKRDIAIVTEKHNGMTVLCLELEKHLNILGKLGDRSKEDGGCQIWKDLNDSISCVSHELKSTLKSYPVYEEKEDPFEGKDFNSLPAAAISTNLLSYDDKIITTLLDACIRGLDICPIKERIQWLRLFITLLQPSLQFSLYKQLFEWCTKSDTHLHPNKISYAASILLCIHIEELLFPSISLPCTEEIRSTQKSISEKNLVTFLYFLSNVLPISTRHEMEKTISFCEIFLHGIEKKVLSTQIKISDFITSIPQILISKYLFVLKRYQYGNISHSFQEDFSLSDHPELWDKICQVSEVKLNQWLIWELSIDPVLDIFTSVTSRIDYSLNCLLNFCQKNSTCFALSVATEVIGMLISNWLKDGRNVISAQSIMLSSFQEFITYKQDCIICDTSEKNSLQMPWFLDYWINIERSDDDMFLIGKKESTDWKMLRILRTLPTWILLKNNFKGKVLDSAQRSIILLINKYVKYSLCDGGFLPLSFILHLFSGIVEHDPEPEIKINYFIKMCPAFKMALLAHHIALQSQFLRLNVSHQLAELQGILNVIDVGSNTELRKFRNLNISHCNWEISLAMWVHRKAQFPSPATVINEEILDELPLQISCWLLFFDLLSLGWNELFSGKFATSSEWNTITQALHKHPAAIGSLDVFLSSKLSNIGPQDQIPPIGNTALAYFTCRLLTTYLGNNLPDKIEKDVWMPFLQALLSARISWGKLTEKSDLRDKLFVDHHLRSILSQVTRISNLRNESLSTELPREYISGLDQCIIDGILSYSRFALPMHLESGSVEAESKMDRLLLRRGRISPWERGKEIHGGFTRQEMIEEFFNILETIGKFPISIDRAPYIFPCKYLEVGVLP